MRKVPTLLTLLVFASSTFHSSCTVTDEFLEAGACLDQSQRDVVQSNALFQMDTSKTRPRPSMGSPRRTSMDDIAKVQMDSSKNRLKPIVDDSDEEDKMDSSKTSQRPTVEDITKVISDASIKDVAKAIAEAIHDEAEADIAKVTDISKELEPLKEGLEAISIKVSSVADNVDDLMSVKDDIKKVAQKKDVSGAEDNLKKEVKTAKELSKRGITNVGKIVKKNQKYLKSVYNDLHDAR